MACFIIDLQPSTMHVDTTIFLVIVINNPKAQ